MRVSLLPALLLALLMGGAVRAEEKTEAEKPKEVEVTKADRYTFKADFRGIRILVGLRLLAVKHRPYPYLPLQLLVANYGKSPVKVDLANIRLVGADGNDYQVASYKEMRSEHRQLQYDSNRARAFPFADLDATPARDVPSRFYPVKGEPTDPNIEVLTGERIVDFLYFRDPEKRSPRRFTLVIEGLLDAPAVRIPMEVPGE